MQDKIPHIYLSCVNVFTERERRRKGGEGRGRERRETEMKAKGNYLG